jgi:hypothetical protein
LQKKRKYVSPTDITNTCNRPGMMDLYNLLDEDMQQQALVHRAARPGQGCLSALGPGAWAAGRNELQFFLIMSTVTCITTQVCY